MGLTDLKEAWVEGKRQFPSRFHDLSCMKALSEMLARRVTEGRMNGILVATGVDLKRHYKQRSSLTISRWTIFQYD